MKKAAIFVLLAWLALAIFPARAGDDFNRAIAYYLVGDLELAQKSLDAHFSSRHQPTVKLGFTLLFKGEKWEATKKFRDYLESNHRSLESLVGISLATADVKNSLASDNLHKVLRMDPGFAPAYACLGQEHFLRNDFPAAEEYFNKSLRYASIAEYKILLGELLLKTGQAQQAVDLIRPLAESMPKNYHYAFLAARAGLALGDLETAARFCEQSQNARPDSKEVQLLRGQLLLAAGDLRQAKSLLGKLKFDYYNPAYSLTLAEVLVKLKDRDAEKYLYEVFSQDPWHPVINKLLGLFHLKDKKANIQNWIRRALLSGLPAQELREEFPPQYRYPEGPSFAIFAAGKIQWLGNGRVAVAGALRSGDKEKMTILDAATLKPIQSFAYEGAIQEIFAAPRQDKIIFSTTAPGNEKVYLYTLIAERNGYRLKPVVGYALDMASVQVAFNADGTMAYVTDGSLSDTAFLSPFSTVGNLGRRQSIYPDHPIAVFSYSYAGERWTQVRKREALRHVPLADVRRYFAVADACRNHAEVAKLLGKGAGLDITTSEEMKILFAAADDHFLISFSDLKNAFQGWAYDAGRNRLSRFDESMFLGAKYYADLDVVAFHPEKNEILVLTRDKHRSLYHFNYHSLLYKKIAGNVLKAALAPDGNTVYLLAERSKALYFSETTLEIVRLSPFYRSKVNSRRDLEDISDCSDANAVYFTTYNGELLKLDEEGKFTSRQVSLVGALHQVSPDKEKAAAFINGRIHVLDWQE